MEGIDHIYIAQIGCGGLIGQVHRVVQGQIPNRESLKLCVTTADASLVLVEQLAHTGGQLATAGAGGCDYYQFPCGFDEIIFAVALVTDNMGDVGGIAGDVVMVVHPYAHGFQTTAEGTGQIGGLIAGEHHRADIQAEAAEYIDQADHIPVVGDAQITADLILFNVSGIDGDHHLYLVLELQQHPQLAVGAEAGQHPGSMIIVIQLTAKLQIKLTAELLDAVADMGGLTADIQFVVKGKPWHGRTLLAEISYPTIV